VQPVISPLGDATSYVEEREATPLNSFAKQNGKRLMKSKVDFHLSTPILPYGVYLAA